MDAITLDISALGQLTDEKLLLLCRQNRNTRIERTCKGELVLMTPAGSETGSKNFTIIGELFMWNKQTKLGIAFDSSAGFTLANGAMRAADAAWMTNERWEQVPVEDRSGFAHICPDFVIELMSPSDRLAAARAKMDEWIENGCRLGWLIDPKREKVYIYRADGSLSVLESFDACVSGEDVLADFELNLAGLR